MSAELLLRLMMMDVAGAEQSGDFVVAAVAAVAAVVDVANDADDVADSADFGGLVWFV